jgi:glycosyltransferase involved in cell wall biosynthesis
LRVPYSGKNAVKIGISIGVLAYYVVRFRPAIVHTHHRRIALLFSVLKRWPLPKFKLIHTSHNVFHSGKLFGRARCDLLTGVSRSVVKNLIEDFRFPGEKVRLVYNGIPEYDGERPPGGGQAAVTVGRLTLQKGHRYLIEAWRSVIQAVPDAVLHIVGDGELREELEMLVRRLDLASHVFFEGFDPRPRPWMLRTAFGILPSLWEGLPLFPLEAFSVERTVVATAVDGTPEIVVDRKTGLLVPPRDVAALAEAAIFMFKHRAEREAMAGEGFRLYRSSFTSGRMLDSYDRCYAEMSF